MQVETCFPPRSLLTSSIIKLSQYLTEAEVVHEYSRECWDGKTLTGQFVFTVTSGFDGELLICSASWKIPGGFFHQLQILQLACLFSLDGKYQCGDVFAEIISLIR